MNKLFAFLKLDFLEAASYKLTFISSFFGIFFASASSFFVSKLISAKQIPSLAPYGGDYFSFVIIGTAFMGLLGIFQRGLATVIQRAQSSGTLEALLITQTSIPTMLIGCSLYPFIFTMIRTISHIALAVFVFGMKLGNINWLGGITVFIFTAICFLSMGILSSSFILVYKTGNPLSWVFGSASGLLGGAVFPIAILPGWIRWVSYFLPITHSLEGMRRSLLSSASFSEILPDILVLAAFGIILLPLSIFAFRLALQKAKRDGTLAHH